MPPWLPDMVAPSSVIGIALVALGLVLTPGPNMVHLVSRSIAHGRRAGFVSLLGIATGFGIYLVAAVLGVVSFFALVPSAYLALKLAGAAYLAYLAWTMIRAKSHPLGVSGRDDRSDSNRRLFTMGLVTNLLNPKIAILYVSLLPQFIDPTRGSIGRQSLLLGMVQIAVALTINATIVLVAGSLASFLGRHPHVARVQRLTSGTILGGLAVRVALDRSRATALS